MIQPNQEKIASTYTGKLLRIDLTHKTHHTEEIPREYYANFISARGLGSNYLYQELKQGVDPLGPENKLLMLIGVLGATKGQGFSKWVVMTKSPLTETITRSFTGGNFGVWMKFAGYDLMVVEGKADRPSYIYIDEEGVKILSAEGFMGLDPKETQLKLKEIHGPRTESACIGVAGERLVRYAVISSGERTASRGGVGAVMGSKKLKAIAINVSRKKLTPYDALKFDQLAKKQIDILKDHPRRKKMSTLGTPYATVTFSVAGMLPVRNFQEGSIQGIEDLSGEEFFRLKIRKAGCYGCMTRCGGFRKVTFGPLEGTVIDGPEYETIYAFGPLLGNTDKELIIAANALCDWYGIDTISTGVCIAFACELFERGLLSADDMDGLEPSWGNRDAIITLIEKIGKREGIGKLLGEGVKRAAEGIGQGSDAYAIHIKGLEIPGYDPRSVKGYALSMATSNIGGSHMYGRPKDEMGGKVNSYAEKNKGESIARVQKEQAIDDSVISCAFGNTGLTLEMLSEYLFAATGIEEFRDPDNLLKIGERIICLERAFNVREGFGRKDDTLPQRMFKDPMKNAGLATGQKVENLDGLLDEYYRAFGYSKEGIPTAEKVCELGLENVIGDIWKDR
jgi:aldehyde:ferredoxin oxidoreductase